MNYESEFSAPHLPLVEASPETAARVRAKAHALLRRGRSATGRARFRAARIYSRLLEPALLLGTVVLSLSWAVSRVLYIVWPTG